MNSFISSAAAAVLLLISHIMASHAWPTPQPPPSLDCCIRDCHGRPDGDYQSCYGCQFYATCSGGLNGDNPYINPTISFWDKRPCVQGTFWNDYHKRCEWPNTYGTCCDEDLCECHSLLPQGPEPCCEAANYVFILDGSGSVDSADFEESKLWLISVVSNHINDESLVAAMQFSSSVSDIHQFSDTQNPRNEMIENIIGEVFQNGPSTDITSAISAASTALTSLAASNTNPKIIVILTDGEHNTGDPEPCTLAGPVGTINTANIRVVSVGLTGGNPGLGCMQQKAADELLIQNDFDFDEVTSQLIECEAICDC